MGYFDAAYFDAAYFDTGTALRRPTRKRGSDYAYADTRYYPARPGGKNPTR